MGLRVETSFDPEAVKRSMRQATGELVEQIKPILTNFTKTAVTSSLVKGGEMSATASKVWTTTHSPTLAVCVNPAIDAASRTVTVAIADQINAKVEPCMQRVADSTKASSGKATDFSVDTFASSIRC